MQLVAYRMLLLCVLAKNWLLATNHGKAMQTQRWESKNQANIARRKNQRKHGGVENESRIGRPRDCKVEYKWYGAT